VADLLAIVSHDHAVPLPGGALDELTGTYESLRGPAPQRETASTGWAAVCALGRTADPAMAGVRHVGDRWAAWAGPLADPFSAATADLAQLDGQFSLIRLDETGEALEVVTDPLGMKPLFTATKGGRTYISTSALVLAKHLRATPSRAGIEAFLCGGIQFGRDTQWEGIERLRPAELLRFTSGGPKADAYWEPRVDEAVGRLSLGQSADYCIESATESFAGRHRDTRPWLDLTGGFDTRLLALLASRAGVEFMANTIGDDDEEDVRLARRIAATKGWPWTRIAPPQDWAERMPALAEEAVVWGDGHLDAFALAGVMYGHREKSKEENRLLNGGGGEQFRDFPWGHELFAAGRSSKVNYERLISWRLLLPTDLSALRTDPTAAVRSAYRTELEHRVEPFSSLPNTTQCDLLYAYKMTGHSGAYQAAAGACIDVEIPFYLKSAFLAAISTAPRHRRFHRLMREMIRRLDPAVATIPTETGGPAEPLEFRSLHRFAPYAWRRGRRFATRVRGRLPRLNENPASTPTLRDGARRALIARLRAEGRLDPGSMRSASLYDSERLEELLDRSVKHPASVDWTALGRITTVELALEAADAGLE
jgi:hypothetical protein